MTTTQTRTKFVTAAVGAVVATVAAPALLLSAREPRRPSSITFLRRAIALVATDLIRSPIRPTIPTFACR
jgi:hypothetical protein